jgi:deazaflavin-dependent oxidoreductase (nitroreductase family)
MPSRIGNSIIKFLINSPFHPLVGRNIAVITVTGCKTGKPIETPVNVVSLGDTLIVISLRNRTWWRNLRGGCKAQLRYRGKLITVIGEVIEVQSEVIAGLKDYFVHYPGYAKFFNIKFDSDHTPNPLDLELASRERILVNLQPI